MDTATTDIPPAAGLTSLFSDFDWAKSKMFENSWDGSFINLEGLITILRSLSRTSWVEDGVDGNQNYISLQSQFFNELDDELTRVSRVYHATAMELKDADDKGRWFGKKNARVVPRVLTSLRIGRGVKVAATVRNIYLHTVLCTYYAQLHRRALRVLMSAHDELTKSTKGAEYVASVWSAGDERGLFLHSALLRELEALQELMFRKLGDAQCREIVPIDSAMRDTPLSLSFRGVGNLSPGTGADAGGLSEDMAVSPGGSPRRLAAPPPGAGEPQVAEAIPPNIAALIGCPVCLDYMYRPHGLGCGHCMCTNCILVANGMARSVAPSLKAMMTHLPFKNGSCPICRQPIKNVPMELTALGRLVARTVPEYYEQCHRVFKAKQKELRERLESQVTKELGMDSNPLFPILDRIPSVFSSTSSQRSQTNQP